jgi:lipoate synthase
MIHKIKQRKIFKIEKLLKDVRGSKSELARVMWVTPTAIEQFLKTWARTVWKQIQYTEAFNKCFETEFSYKILFSKND